MLPARRLSALITVCMSANHASLRVPPAMDPVASRMPQASARPSASDLERQGERIDVGSFTLYIGGQRTGREQFSIRRMASQDGAVIELRAESAIGERKSAVRLETDSAGTPVRYSLEERTGAELTRRLGGQRLRGRFTTLARSVTGEASREYLLVPGAIILEEDGLLQYALLIRGRHHENGEGITVPTLTPTENRQGVVRLVMEASLDSVVIAGVRRAASRWRAVPVSGDARTIWADTEGRLLRVLFPARGLDAIRDDVPR